MIYTSRVGDGVCDCCDGSDEIEASTCPNTCAEVAATRTKLLERLQEGIAKAKEARRDAKNTRQRWRVEIDDIKAQLPDLERRLQDALPPAVAAEIGSLKELVDSLKSQVRQLEAEVKQRQTREAELQVENERLRADCADKSGPGPDGGADNKGGAAKQVSEYAKWMDNSETLLQEKEEKAADKSVSEPPAESQVAQTQDNSGVSAGASDATGLSVNSTEIKETIDAKRKRVEDLEGKVAFWSSDKLGYFSLLDRCLEHKVAGYAYKLCFFKDAHQDSVSLGKWSGWRGNGGSFTDGQSCGDGLSRSMRVKFRCAGEDAVVEVSEPNRCTYEAIVHTPGACGKRSREELEKALPDIRFPRDEL